MLIKALSDDGAFILGLQKRICLNQTVQLLTNQFHARTAFNLLPINLVLQ